MAGQKGNTNKPIDGEARNINITIRLSKNELKEIERIAKELDIPPTRLIRNLALTSLKDAKFLSKLGVLKGIKKLKDFEERFRNPEKYNKTLEIT